MARRMQTAQIISFASREAVEDEPGADRRRAPRRRVLKSALAAFSGRFCTIPCVVRDLSATGARLRSDSSLSIPDRFELCIPLDGLEAECEVMWRRGEDIGVRFLSAPHRVAPTRYQVVNPTQPDRKPSLLRKRTVERG